MKTLKIDLEDARTMWTICSYALEATDKVVPKDMRKIHREIVTGYKDMLAEFLFEAVNTTRVKKQPRKKSKF